MTNSQLTQALRKQYRDPNAHIEQVVNVMIGLLRMVGMWAVMTTSFTGIVCIPVLITLDVAAYSVGQLQELLRTTVILVGGCAALACVYGNAGRFKNLFRVRAVDELQRSEGFKASKLAQEYLVEEMLLEHGLIKGTDVEWRRGKARHRAQIDALRATGELENTLALAHGSANRN